MKRIEAAALGLKTYDTGRPCKHGHPPARYTSTGICVACQVVNAAATAQRRRAVVDMLAAVNGGRQ